MSLRLFFIVVQQLATTKKNVLRKKWHLLHYLQSQTHWGIQLMSGYFWGLKSAPKWWKGGEKSYTLTHLFMVPLNQLLDSFKWLMLGQNASKILSTTSKNHQTTPHSLLGWGPIVTISHIASSQMGTPLLLFVLVFC